jgi:hypothetical protein
MLVSERRVRAVIYAPTGRRRFKRLRAQEMPPKRPISRKPANPPDRTSGPSTLRPTRGRLRAGGRLLAAVMVVVAIALFSWHVSSISRADRHTSAPKRVAAGATSIGAPQAGFRTYSGALTDGASIVAMYDSLMQSIGQVVSVDFTITGPTLADIKSVLKTLQLGSNCNSKSPPANCGLLLGQAGVRFSIKNAGTVPKTNVTYSNGVYHITGLYEIGKPTLDSKGYYTVPIAAVNDPSATGAGDADDHA